MRQKLFEPEFVLDLRRVSALRGINANPDGGVEIGALTALRAIERSELLRRALSGADGGRGHRRFARAAQHGNDRREHLSRHALSLVQPVAHVAQRLRILHQERWRPLPRCTRRNEMLGGVFWGYASGAACVSMRKLKSPVLGEFAGWPCAISIQAWAKTIAGCSRTNWLLACSCRRRRQIIAASTQAASSRVDRLSSGRSGGCDEAIQRTRRGCAHRRSRR